ncbi:DUF4145 domain-containing protein [Burkholderia sp. MSMB1078WGS]|uniref:DUF4145 domain-containing protein n=1 Tax=Burkholderia sp. MSMB1078WGS TaxID=1637900 RepID=UPI0009E6BB0C
MRRLAVPKLYVPLGESGKHIDSDIASLVQKGLRPKIQRAPDIVRVIGNESVHPVNLTFGTTMITDPREVDALYERLPEIKREAIERRDTAKPAK